MNKTITALGLAALTTLTAAAADFDITTQRGERQTITMPKGAAVVHDGPVVTPTPQRMKISRFPAGTLDSGKGYQPVGTHAPYDFDLLQAGVPISPYGIPLFLKIDDAKAAKAGCPNIEGAYALSVGDRGVYITARDVDGLYYGMLTLAQLDRYALKNGGLPYMTIVDWPTLPARGVVEGFYGNPWSHEVRLSLIDFYGAHKMNTYVFGPKDDPYHSSPHWREPYPEAEAAKLRELVDACRRNHVEFVWAIHPGKDIQWNEEDYNHMVDKFQHMYDLGVRRFAIHFDDIEGIGTDSNRQVELVNRLTEEFVKPKGDVKPFIVCPTDYSRMWASPRPDGQLATYGNKLDPEVCVFYTGDVVCSDLTQDTMQFFNPLVKRPGFYWWNFPVSDYCRNYILQGPVYGLDADMTSEQLSGFVSNPMEHGEASKLALFGVADYTWNPKAYNPIDNWERGLVELTPEAAPYYRTFAIHSADTETGYRRAESWETTTFTPATRTDSLARALRSELNRIIEVPQMMELHCQDTLLMAELRPWLKEFGKLGSRCLRTLDLMEQADKATPQKAWEMYAANLMGTTDREEYNAHKSGTMKLQPFYEEGMYDMGALIYNRISGKPAKRTTPIGTFANMGGRYNTTRLMLDGDTATYYTSAAPQRPDSWIGLDLGQITPVSRISIRQGRNSVNDVDFFDHAVVEVSTDGNRWAAVSEPLVNTYDIELTFEPTDARYVRLRRLDSKRTNYASVRTFDINGTDALSRMTDTDPSTGATLSEPMTIVVNKGVKNLVLLCNEAAKVNADGKQYTGAYITIPTNGAKEMTFGGDATIYEIIQL